MASYLQIENISKSYGPKVLFEHIDFNINEGDKVALIAPNGSGKTSLLRFLAGKDASDGGGKVLFLKDIRIAFLEQEYAYDPQRTVREQILDDAKKQWKIEGEAQWEYELRMEQLLTQFGLGGPDKRMDQLSGGEVKRVAIVSMLASEPDFYIMDEPTNHLDLDAIELLENFLKQSRRTLFMVTHDRYFLDRICNTVMELDRGQIYIYRGDYVNFLERRQDRIDQFNAESERVRNLFRRELEWIHATPCARTGKAQYRINAFHELADRASQVYTTRQITLEGVGNASRLGGKIINCRHVQYDWEGIPMLRDFTYNFQRCDKVGIVGRNGVGKSTFLDLLTGAIAPDSGVIDRGETLKIGYYRQQGMEFRPGDTVLDIVPDTRLLGHFLFPHDMLSTRVERLSGGEKRRLYLLTILMQEPNLLILDEPTNDLDIVTLNILEEYLKEFQGSLLIVSHDRHFLDRVTDHLLVFCGEGIVKDFIGSFSEYRAYIRDVEKRRAGASAPRADGNYFPDKFAGKPISAPPSTTPTHGKPVPAPSSTTPTHGSSCHPERSEGPARQSKARKLTWKEQRELEAIEAELPQLEAEKAELEAKMSSGTLPYAGLQAASERIRTLMDEISRREERWLELSE